MRDLIICLCIATALLSSCAAAAGPGPESATPPGVTVPPTSDVPPPEALPDEPAPTPTAAGDVRLLVSNAVRDLCSDPLREQVRQALPPDAAFCGPGVSDVFVQVQQGGHEVFVVAYRDETPSYVDGPVLYGSHVVFDGTAESPWEPEEQPFWRRLGDLSGLPADQAQTLLQAVLLESGLFYQLATMDEARRELGAWDDALALVESQPPGLYGDDGEWLLRIWASEHESERGVQCSHLSKLELGLTADGAVSEVRQESWADGTRLGQPCGTPPPARGE